MSDHAGEKRSRAGPPCHPESIKSAGWERINGMPIGGARVEGG
jgi:hypothetical protein